jgi:tetratricopeptide (TPR) repeat protein
VVEELSTADIADVGPFEEQAKELVAACEAELAVETDERKRARLHFEMARLFEGPLRELRKAMSHYQEARKLAPEHVPTLEGARRVLLARKSYQGALELFDAELRLTPEPAHKAALLYEKGRVLADHLGRRDEARECYQVALELAPNDATLLRALEQIHAEARDHAAVATMLGRQAQAVRSDSRLRSALLLQRARIHESRQKDGETAIGIYETALRLDPGSAPAVEALKRLHHKHRRFQDMAQLLLHEAEHTQDAKVRVAGLYGAARLHAEKLGNRDEAITLMERAAAVSGEDPLVLSALAELYEGAERYPTLVDALARLAAVTTDVGERAGLLHRIGELTEHRLREPADAAPWYERVLQIDPTFLPSLHALGGIYERAGRFEDLIRIITREAQQTEEPYRKAAAHARMGAIYEEHLTDPVEAVEQHQRALLAVPRHATSFKALDRLLTAAGRYRDLVRLHEHGVEHSTEAHHAIAHLLRIATVQEESLGEHAQAADAYRRVLERDPDHLGAIQGLERTAERSGRYDELLRALDLEIERCQDEGQRIALLHRTGEVLEHHIGDRDGALLRYRSVVDRDPRYVPVLSSLARLYHGAGRFHDLLGVYELELELLSGKAGAAPLLHKMGELCRERLGADEKAIYYYRQALQVDPTFGPAIRSLTRKLAERGDYADLVEVLELEIAGLTDPAARCRTAYRMGEVYEHALGRPTKAIEAYEAAREAVPGHRPSLQALARLRAEQKSWDAAIADLEFDLAEGAAEGLRIGALLRQATIWSEELNEPRRAIACLESVLAIAPEHVPALVMLEGLHRQVGDHAKLARLLGVLARVVEDNDARVAALRELARLQETRAIGEVADQQATYEAILRLDPDDVGALTALERIALETEDAALLARVDERLAGLSDDVAERAMRLTRRAEHLETLGTTEAILGYRAALELDPGSLAATRGLSRIAQIMDDPNALSESARREAAITRSGETASRLLVRSARTRLGRLGDVEGAVRDLERALELYPDSEEAALALCEALGRAGDPGRLADTLARAGGRAKKNDRVAWLWQEVARLQAEQLGNVPHAIASLQRALKCTPTDVVTLRRIAELYERDGQAVEAVQQLQRIVKLAPGPDVLRDTHMRLATIWEDRLGDRARALVSLQAVLALDAEHRGALERMAEIHEREARLQEATATAERLLAVARSAEARGRALARLARLHQKRGQRPKAMAVLEEGVELSGAEGPAAEQYRALCTTADEWQRYVSALERYVDGGGVKAAEAWLEMSRVLGDRLGATDGALRAIRRGIDAAPDALTLHEGLVQRLRADGRHREALDAIRRMLQVDAANATGWALLSQTFLDLERRPEARIAAEPLRILGRPEVCGLPSFDDIRARPGVARPLSLEASILRKLLPHAPGAPEAGALLAALEPALSKLFPPDLEAYGVSARDRLGPRAPHPLYEQAERVAAVLGLKQLALYVHKVRTRGIGVEFVDEGLMVVIPAPLAELPTAEQVFLLGRVLMPYTLSFSAMERLTPRELEVLLASAARIAQPDFGAGLTSEDFLNEQSKRIYKAVPRRQRKALEQAAAAYVTAPRIEILVWREALDRMVTRASGVLCDDLAAAVRVLKETEREMSALTGADIVRRADKARDLFLFWASDDAMALRRHLGLLV